jgi:hypothetical protein
MSIVDEQFEKLLYSVERFKEDMKKGNKRAAIGDMDFIRDRAKGIIYLLLAQLEDEMTNDDEESKKDIKNEIEKYYDGIDRDRLFNPKDTPE